MIFLDKMDKTKPKGDAPKKNFHTQNIEMKYMKKVGT